MLITLVLSTRNFVFSMVFLSIFSPPPFLDLAGSIPRSLRVFGGPQHCFEERIVGASSFFVWAFCHQLAENSACVLHLFHDVALFGEEHSADRRRLHDSSCVQNFSQGYQAHHVRRVFFSTSLLPPCLHLGSFFLPLPDVPPVCCPRKDNRTSLINIIGQSLELNKQAHFFWDLSVRGVSAPVRRPFIQMLTFDVPPKQPQFIEKRGALQVRGCKRWFCLRLFLPFASPSRSIHEASPTSKSLHYVSSPCDQIQKTVSHTYFGSRHRRDVKLQSIRATQPTGMHFMRHSCFVRFKKLGAFSHSFFQHLHWYVLCVSFSGSLFTFFGFLGGGHFVPQYLAQITYQSQSRGQKSSAHRKKPLSHLHSVRAQSRHPRQILSAS